jgi:hypothetical protein
MNRSGHKNTNFFKGIEVERTPAYGMKTLFVVGVHPIESIVQHIDEYTQHIFFGANHSFVAGSFDEWTVWENIIGYFLDNGFMCTLDIPVACAEEFLEGPLVEDNNFIPQIRIPLPYIRLWNYNTMIKLDDRDFASTNPGVWCHRLHNLMSEETYTDWNQYKDDKTL